MPNPAYISKDEILAIVSKVVEDSIGDATFYWHPEDAYYQVESAIKSAFVALNELASMRHSKNV